MSAAVHCAGNPLNARVGSRPQSTLHTQAVRHTVVPKRWSRLSCSNTAPARDSGFVRVGIETAAGTALCSSTRHNRPHEGGSSICATHNHIYTKQTYPHSGQPKQPTEYKIGPAAGLWGHIPRAEGCAEVELHNRPTTCQQHTNRADAAHSAS